MIFSATIRLDSPTDLQWKADDLVSNTIGDNIFELEPDCDIYRCTELVDLPLLLNEPDVEVIGMGSPELNIPLQ